MLKTLTQILINENLNCYNPCSMCLPQNISGYSVFENVSQLFERPDYFQKFIQISEHFSL